jgi:hypothetical protein
VTNVGKYFDRVGTIGDFGVEVEVEFLNDEMQYSPQDRWGVEVDGSLRGASREYVLRHPQNLPEAIDSVTHLYDAMDDRGHRIRDSVRAGVHIHLNCQQMDMRQLMSIITTFLLFETPLVATCGDGRSGNMFCLRSYDAEFWLFRVIDFFKTGQCGYINTDDIRYSALNLKALSSYGSVEFRTLRTPVTAQPLIDWITAISRLKDYALSFRDPRDLIFACSQTSYRELFIAAFGQDMCDKVPIPEEDWDYLRRDALDRAQILAFSVNETTWKKVWRL